MQLKSLSVTHTSGVAVIWLNRPDTRNAVHGNMVRELTQVLSMLEEDASVRAIVLAGSGPVFCSGADARWVQRLGQASLAANTRDAHAMANLLQILDCMSKPTVARVHGAAYGDALGLIAACDIVVASMSTDFCIAEVKFGLSATLCIPYLLRAIGARHTRRYLLSGEVFAAAEAYRVGLVHELATEDKLDATVNEILGHLVLGAPKALAATKECIARTLENRISPPLVPELCSHHASMRASAEAREGINAFLDKRVPVWPAKARSKTAPKAKAGVRKT